MNTLSMTYRLTRHLSVEAQSGAAQALDLLYQIEFGGP
jgi:autotransporter translocation and assembly factor TamB